MFHALCVLFLSENLEFRTLAKESSIPRTERKVVSGKAAAA